jgi:hypothetical protein
MGLVIFLVIIMVLLIAGLVANEVMIHKRGL